MAFSKVPWCGCRQSLRVACMVPVSGYRDLVGIGVRRLQSLISQCLVLVPDSYRVRLNASVVTQGQQKFLTLHRLRVPGNSNSPTGRKAFHLKFAGHAAPGTHQPRQRRFVAPTVSSRANRRGKACRIRIADTEPPWFAPHSTPCLQLLLCTFMCACVPGAQRLSIAIIKSQVANMLSPPSALLSRCRLPRPSLHYRRPDQHRCAFAAKTLCS